MQALGNALKLIPTYVASNDRWRLRINGEIILYLILLLEGLEVISVAAFLFGRKVCIVLGTVSIRYSSGDQEYKRRFQGPAAMSTSCS